VAHLGMSLLFYLTAGVLLWEKRHSFWLQRSRFSQILGALLVAIALWQSFELLHDPALTSPQLHPTLRLLPWVSAVAVGLLASGWQGLKQYGQAITLLFFLGVPSVLFSFLPDLSPITAQFSTGLLRLAGFDASVQDVYISLPTGAVKVYAGCSGVESMTYLLGISVIALMLFPIARIKQVFVPILAMLIGFGVNGVRVAVMAVLVASQNQAAFIYWHQGQGSLIFGVVSVLVFGLCYRVLHQYSTKETHKTEMG
ncbi:MAG TPA: cyanoexosortase A, partial [Coleofasciculaceae cyanobacterium]